MLCVTCFSCEGVTVWCDEFLTTRCRCELISILICIHLKFNSCIRVFIWMLLEHFFSHSFTCSITIYKTFAARCHHSLMSRVMCGEEVELINSLAYLGGVVHDDGAKFLNSCRVRIGPGAASSHGRFGGDYMVSEGWELKGRCLVHSSAGMWKSLACAAPPQTP